VQVNPAMATHTVSSEGRKEQAMSETAGRIVQLSLAGAVLVCVLVLIQIRAIGSSDVAAAVTSEQAARTFNIRLEQAEMLMQTGCIEAGTY
jgi:hypothetical protein